MEQTNMVMAIYQTMAAQGMLPKTGKTGDKSGDFQKLLDQKSQPAKNDAPAQEKPKVDGTTAENEEASVKEDPLEQVKKLAEQGYVISQPSIAAMTLDGKTYEPGEYVIAWKGPDVQFIPVTGLDESQMRQLQELIDPVYEMDVSDPEADALLEATDPTVEHGPAQMLEKLADEVAGVEENGPQLFQTGEAGADTEAEITDADVGPQTLFHDVKAAPVKVGDVYTEQPKEVTIQSEDVRAALQAPIEEMVLHIKDTFKKTNPDLASDIIQNGILLTGGGGLLSGLDRYLTDKLEIPVWVSETALTNVVSGCLKVLETPTALKQTLMRSK